MTQLTGRLLSTAIAILPAPLHCRLQRQKILELAEEQSFKARVLLSEVKKEIQGRVEKLMLFK